MNLALLMPFPAILFALVVATVKNSGFHLNEVQSVTEIDQDGRMTFRELTNQLSKVNILHLLLWK